MLPLSEELRQAIVELRTWAALNNELWTIGALGVVEKAQRFVARAEQTHPDSPFVLPDVGPRDVLVFRGVEPGPDGHRSMAEAIIDHYAEQARSAGAPDTDPVERHVPLIIWLYDDSTVEKLNEAQMAAAGWIRKPSTERTS